MCVLILSYKPDTDEVCRGCVVGHFWGAAHAEWCETGEEAINHVAHLNAWNEPGAADYEHFFCYPDDVCPYESKDQETGEIVYKHHCLPMSKLSLDLDNEDGGIPEHLRGAIEAKEEEIRVQAQEYRKRQQEEEERRRKERQRQDDERQLEYLKKKLGK
jgi:hypothetical protein